MSQNYWHYIIWSNTSSERGNCNVSDLDLKCLQLYFEKIDLILFSVFGLVTTLHSQALMLHEQLANKTSHILLLFDIDHWIGKSLRKILLKLEKGNCTLFNLLKHYMDWKIYFSFTYTVLSITKIKNSKGVRIQPLMFIMLPSFIRQN